MKMRKVMCLFMAGALVLGMTACGAKTDDANADKASGSGTSGASMADEAGASGESSAADKSSGAGEANGEKTKITIQWKETDSTQVEAVEQYI